VEPRVIDRDLAPDDADLGLRGLATDPAVLREAGIGDARGIVVGTDNDIDNLSIAVLARELQPGIFVVMRQNERKHSPLFDAVRVDLGALSGHMVAAEVLRIIRAPQLSYFLRLARQEDETWAGALLERLREAVGDETAESWSVPIDEQHAPAVVAALRGGCTVTVGDLMRAPDNRELRLRAVPLLVQHVEGKHLLPSPDLALCEGDRLLMGGRAIARARLRLSVNDDGVLDYILHGAEGPGRRLPWRPLLRSRGR
jgi:voltage-gated potassium channel